VPLAITGSEHGLKGAFLRKPLMIRIGQPYTIDPTESGKIPPDLMEQLTADMMQRIAVMLPDECRGPYAQLPVQP
jgi:1-acyl-sn-glycerol-3-phosphate acyltransferase